MDDSHAKGLEVFKEMMPGLVPDNVTSLRDGGFADPFIALRAGDELRIHFQIALHNGLSVEEIEEVI
jgi:4-carboxymuconolactone decarboxylase